MSWWGKLAGGALGFLMGGPLGAAMGAALGHRFDQGFDRHAGGQGWQQIEQVQGAFFTATFTVMGCLAKADGKVSPQEIEMAEQVMREMDLAPEQREAAVSLFNAGKEPGFDWQGTVAQFAHLCRGRIDLLRLFIEIQVHAMYADGALHPEEQQLLRRIADQVLGLPRHEFEAIERRVRAARGFHAGASSGRSDAAAGLDPYAVLGLQRSASDDDVKRTYRKLMNQHHPDKLIAKGLPEEMIRTATGRTQEIKAAYETIRKTRRVTSCTE